MIYLQKKIKKKKKKKKKRKIINRFKYLIHINILLFLKFLLSSK